MQALSENKSELSNSGKQYRFFIAIYSRDVETLETHADRGEMGIGMSMFTEFSPKLLRLYFK